MGEPENYAYACKACKREGIVQLCVGKSKAEAFAVWEEHADEVHGYSL